MPDQLSNSRSKLNLLMVGLRWPPEQLLAELVTGLADAGIDVTIISDVVTDVSRRAKLKPNLSLMQTPKSLPVLLLYVSWLTIRTWMRGQGTAQLLNTCRRQPGNRVERLQNVYQLLNLMRSRWDVIHFAQSTPLLDLLPLLSLKCPVIVSCWGDRFNPDSTTSSLQVDDDSRYSLLKSLTVLHCSSESVKQEAVCHGIDPAKIRVIYPAVDYTSLSSVEKIRDDTGVFRVMTVGPCGWTKGFEYALLAVQLLRKRVCRSSST